jgi:tRNA (mo5U34)-methyltransferase
VTSDLDVDSQQRQGPAGADDYWFASPFDFDGQGTSTQPRHVQRRFRRRMRLLQIPKDLTGKTVLDMGSWDGFWAFECERRGAKRVLAIDTWVSERHYQTFLYAHERMGSKIDHVRMDAHDLSPEAIGKFDLVLCLGLLYHLRHPLRALERIRSVTSDQLILETNSLIPAVHERTPMITFFPGDECGDSLRQHDGGFPTQSWLACALHAAGFARHEFIYSPSFRYYKKVLALLTNTPGRGRLIAHAFVK